MKLEPCLGVSRADFSPMMERKKKDETSLPYDILRRLRGARMDSRVSVRDATGDASLGVIGDELITRDDWREHFGWSKRYSN